MGLTPARHPPSVMLCWTFFDSPGGDPALTHDPERDKA